MVVIEIVIKEFFFEENWIIHQTEGFSPFREVYI